MPAKDSLDIRKSEIVCPICGHVVEQKGFGRPRVYHPDCRKLESLLAWVEDLIAAAAMTEEKRRLLRGRLWYLANCLNQQGKV